jgi:hypothetical protein
VAASFKRPQIWKAALLSAAEHPILGAGPGEFAHAFLRRNFRSGYGVGDYRNVADHAHSELMEAAVEFGLPGLLLLLAALAAFLRSGAAVEKDWTREAAVGAFIAMAVQLSADNMLHMPGLGLLFASALGAVGVMKGKTCPIPAGAILAGLALAAVSWAPSRMVARWQHAAAVSNDPQARIDDRLKIVRLMPADAAARADLAWAYLALKPSRVDEALRQLETARTLSPFNALYPAALADLSLGRREPRDILALASRAAELEPDFSLARMLQAEARLLMNQPSEARSALAQACDVETRLAPRRAAGRLAREGYVGLLTAFDADRYRRLARLAGSAPCVQTGAVGLAP